MYLNEFDDIRMTLFKRVHVSTLISRMYLRGT